MKSMKFDSVVAADNFAASLGVSPERESILDEASQKAFEKKEGRYSEVLADLSGLVETPNELAYMVFQLGYNIGRREVAAINPLAALMNSMKD